MPDLLDQVRSIIADRLHRDKDSLKGTDNLTADLGADSLDLAEIIMDLEDAFNLRFQSLEVESISPLTIDNIIAHLRKLKPEVK